jgi:predicted phage terminase large subunit-like protein
LSDERIILEEEQVDAFYGSFLKDDFWYFLQEFWPIVEKGRAIIWNWHIKYLCDVVQSSVENWEKGNPCLNIVCNIPPGMTKSTIFSRFAPAWILARNPEARIMSVSYSSGLSGKHSLACRDIMQDARFRHYFPESKLRSDMAGKTFFMTEQNGWLMATSVGGTATGMHGDFVILDDVVDPQQAESEKERENANSFIQTTLSSRLTDKERSAKWLIMQRLHDDDPTSTCLNIWEQSSLEEIGREPHTIHIRIPATMQGDPLIPIFQEVEEPPQPYRSSTMGKYQTMDIRRLNDRALDGQRTALGAQGFSAQMLQDPVQAGGNKLKEEWFQQRITLRQLEQWAKQDGTKLKWMATIDGAYTGNRENAATGVLVFTIFRGKLYLRNFREFFVEFHEGIKKIPVFLNANGLDKYGMTYAEPKATGKPLVQTLRAKGKLNIQEDKNPSQGKEERVENIAPYVEAGNVVLIEGPNWEPFIEQCIRFPKAKHKDLVDCFTMAVDKVDWSDVRNEYHLFDLQGIRDIKVNDWVEEGRPAITLRKRGRYTTAAVWKGWVMLDYWWSDDPTSDWENQVRAWKNQYEVPVKRIAYEVLEGRQVRGNLKSAVFFESKRKSEPDRKQDIPYQDLETQCIYRLSQVVNEYQMYARMPDFADRMVYEELSMLERTDHPKYISVTSEKDMKDKIGRDRIFSGPLIMRAYFELVRKGRSGGIRSA